MNHEFKSHNLKCGNRIGDVDWIYPEYSLWRKLASKVLVSQSEKSWRLKRSPEVSQTDEGKG